MIFVPQRHIGQGVGEMSLKLLIKVFLFLRVLGTASLVNQKVGLPAPKAAAIRAVRGDGFAMKHVVKNVRRFHPNPGQAVHLKPTGFDIPVECAPVIAAKIHLDSDLGQLMLEDGGQPDLKRIAGGFISQFQWGTWGKSGLGQQHAGFFGIVFVPPEIGSPSPVIRW